MKESILLSDPKQLMEALVICLDSLMSQCEFVQGQPSVFDLKNKPTITFPNYLMRIFSFMGCSLSAYIYSLILIDKIQQENPAFKITQKNIHRLLFTAIVVATKFVDDKYYNNSYYTKVGGIPLQTLNTQQQCMLELLNYHCPANPDIFNSYLERLENFKATITPQDTNNLQEKLNPTTPSQTQASKQKKRQIRQKRQRSREKNIERYYQTQESRQIEPF